MERKEYMLTEIQIEDLHEKYRGQFEKQGYTFAGSLDIHLPFLEMQADYRYLDNSHMPKPEKILCDCIQAGVCKIEEINFVLSVDLKIVEKMVERLIQSQILKMETGVLKFTEEGKVLYRSNLRPVREENSIPVGFNLITGEWQLLEEDIFQNEVNVSGVKLEVRKSLKIDDQQQMRALRKLITEKVLIKNTLEDLNISRRKVLGYKHELLLLYVNDHGEINHLVYDPRAENFDFEISRYLQESYSDQRLKELEPIQNLLAKEKQVVEEFHQPIQSLRYLQNREIREITKYLFQNAEKSVYIISPWLGTEDFVLTEEFLEQMEMGLNKKKLEIHIMYGYVSKEKLEYLIMKDQQEEEAYHLGKGKHYIKNREVQTQETADKLRIRFSNYQNFHISYRNTHEKVLCYDDRYCLIGSYNYLSYDGGEKNNYQGFNFRKEGAVFIEDEDFTKDLIQKLM